MNEPLDLPTPNLPLLRKVLDHIDAHPAEWVQTNVVTETACGTAYCIAGHAVVMSGGVVGGTFAGEIAACGTAQRSLGITTDEARALFFCDNDRADVQRYAEQIAARAGERL